ncbi:hypothetical protein KEM48_009477 [Puccinia striiformis f. sp. tritici PST-130]|nr:hypothetical protein KEM48_009477 [Puccinia striiformis f. sp. tritici PST-130]
MDSPKPTKLLVIPGPIEVADEVLLANASASVSHVSAGFIGIFGETLEMLLKLFTPQSRRVVSFRGQRFGNLRMGYGSCELGRTCVCSVASEEIRFDDWNLDVVLSASQKGLGTPPGLCISIASDRALKTLETRKTPISTYYASWKKWLPIMKAYQAGDILGTNDDFILLVWKIIHQQQTHKSNHSLHKSLKLILENPKLSLEERFLRHKQASQKVKEAVENKLGLKQLSVNQQSNVIGKMLEKDLVIAGGLHKDCKDRYIRIGHMGLTAIEHPLQHIDKIVVGLTDSLKQLGHDPVQNNLWATLPPTLVLTDEMEEKKKEKILGGPLSTSEFGFGRHDT